MRIFAGLICNLRKELQNSKKVPSGHSGQKDFPAGQVTFCARFLSGQGQANYLLSYKRAAAVCPKDKLEFTFSQALIQVIV